jgi:hypothetical protein
VLYWSGVFALDTADVSAVANLMALLPSLKHFRGSYMCLPPLLAHASDMLSVEITGSDHGGSMDMSRMLSYKMLRNWILVNPDLATLALC